MKLVVALALLAPVSAKWVRTMHSGNHTHEDVKRLLGTVMRGEPNFFELPEKVDGHLAASDLPTDFDSRTAFKGCEEVISHVRDQSDCGSCWAFGSTEALTDRRCIAYGETTYLSAQHTTSCCSGLRCGMSMGCNGGQPSSAWQWFTREGVVTGGDYGDSSTCWPYAFDECAHHVDSDTLPDCGDICADVGQTGDECATPKCQSSCSGDSSIDFDGDKHLAKSAYSLRSVDNIMSDIYQYGPVTAAFSVYDDFPDYQSGVYQKTRGSSYLGGHAIEIVGWGVEDGEDYWLVKNSWNPTWGDGGYFKILKGSNECGIEGQVSAGLV